MALITTVLTGLCLVAAGLATVAVLSGPLPQDATRTDRRGNARWLAALGWGLGVVPLLTFWIAVLLHRDVTRTLLALVGSGNLLGSCLVVVFQRRRFPCLADLVSVRDWVSDLRPILGALAVSLLFLFFFDSRQAPDVSCIYRAAFIATGHIREGTNLLWSNPDDARLGNAALLSAAVALHGRLGFRFAYAVCGFLVALGGFEIGNRLGGRAWGWFGLVSLSLNSYLLTIRLPDENLFALAAGCTVLPLWLKRSPRTPEWVLAGALFGLLFTIRHVMVLAIGAPLFAAWRQKNRVAAVVAFLAAFACTTSTEHLHHLLAMGSLFRFESNTQYPALPYEFLGIEFQWQGLLNWPLHSEVVRTPFNPFPTFVLWPLAIARHLGLLGFIAVHAGFVASWFRDRREAAFWTLWALPIVLALAVQEAWDQANKMGVILIVSQAALPWVASAWGEARRRPIRSIVLLLALSATGSLGVRALRDWRAPADPRYPCLTGATGERPDLVDRSAHDATEVGLFPRRPIPSHVTVSFLANNARTGLCGLAAPDQTWTPWPLGFFPDAVPPTGDPVTVRLDLSRDPWTSEFVSLSPDAPGEDLTDRDRVSVFALPEVPWSPFRPLVLVRRGNAATAILVDFAWPPRPDCPPGFQEPGDQERLITEYRCEVSAWMVGEERGSPCALKGVPVTPVPSPVVHLRIPAGALSIAVIVNWRGENYRLWHGVASPSGLAWDTAHEPFWHN